MFALEKILDREYMIIDIYNNDGLQQKDILNIFRHRFE